MDPEVLERWRLQNLVEEARDAAIVADENAAYGAADVKFKKPASGLQQLIHGLGGETDFARSCEVHSAFKEVTRSLDSFYATVAAMPMDDRMVRLGQATLHFAYAFGDLRKFMDKVEGDFEQTPDNRDAVQLLRILCIAQNVLTLFWETETRGWTPQDSKFLMHGRTCLSVAYLTWERSHK